MQCDAKRSNLPSPPTTEREEVEARYNSCDTTIRTDEGGGRSSCVYVCVYVCHRDHSMVRYSISHGLV